MALNDDKNKQLKRRQSKIFKAVKKMKCQETLEAFFKVFGGNILYDNKDKI